MFQAVWNQIDRTTLVELSKWVSFTELFFKHADFLFHLNIYSTYPKYNHKCARALRLSIFFRDTLHVRYLCSITPRFWEEISRLLPWSIRSHRRIPAGVADGESTSAETQDLITPLVIIATSLIDRLLSVCLFSPVRTRALAQKGLQTVLAGVLL